MNTNLTRRSFAAMSLSALALALPGLSKAQSTGYRNPGLLIEPTILKDAVNELSNRGQNFEGVGFTILDVRPFAEFQAGHISHALHLDPNAVVAPQSPISGSLRPVAEIEELLRSLGIDAASIVVLYDDRGGFHAARMLWLMEYLGHRNVAVLNGGWSGWVAAEGEVSTESYTPEAAVFQAALSPRRYASAEDVLIHRDASNGVLIDVRPTHMYDEGHIPWAVNVPWALNLGEDGRFRSADDLLAHFSEYGVTPDKDVIMHCQSGLASSHSYVALRLLGFPRVRVYHRSWSEWGSDPDLPKAST